MSIANYSTSVESIKSVGEIQGMLIAHGARSIQMNYAGDKTVESLSFVIDTPHGEVNIRLPVNPAAVLKIFERDELPPRYCNHEQAVKVAWRILKDWVRAQMAILETEMVQMEQIFLPYMTMEDGQTLFEVFEQKGKLLTGGAK